MSTGTDPQPPPGPDRAEAPSPVACAACLEPVAGRYFEINRTIVCDPCRRSIEAQLRGGPGLARLARAALYGLGAAIAGSALDLAFLSFSAYDWSIVAVAVGYLVGKMVRKGGGGLGGLACRLIAVVLTYASLGMTYFAFALLAFRQGGQAAPPAPTPGVVLSMLTQAFEMPVLRMRSSPIQVVFIGFALWEAWRLNRPRRIVVTGPHRVDGAAPPEVAPGA